MFTQFKGYMEQTKWPVLAGSAIGLVSGVAGGIAAVHNANSNLIVLQECQNNLDANLSAEVAGGLSGLTAGVLLGIAHPAVQMFFTWCSDTYRRANYEITRRDDVVELDRVRNGSP